MKLYTVSTASDDGCGLDTQIFMKHKRALAVFPKWAKLVSKLTRKIGGRIEEVVVFIITIGDDGTAKSVKPEYFSSVSKAIHAMHPPENCLLHVKIVSRYALKTTYHAWMKYTDVITK